MNTRIGKVVIACESIVLMLMLLYCHAMEKIQEFPINTNELVVQRSTRLVEMGEAVSKPRIVDEEIVFREKKYYLSDEDYENLLRIVEAEATGEDLIGKMLVANVVMNRVNSDEFPDSVTQVIYDRTDGKVQFSPVADGRLYSVQITDETREAVERVMYGEDVSGGALYFVSAKRADQAKYIWFTQNLDYLFAHGGHEFYK